MKNKKLHLWVKIAGWSGTIPAASIAMVLKVAGDEFFSAFGGSWIFIVNIFFIVGFSVYLLTTAQEKSWENPQKLFRALLFSLVFSSVFQSIFVGIAYLIARKDQKTRQ